MRDAPARIAGDWQQEHQAHACDYGAEPWGIQWGGQGHTDFVCDIVRYFVRGQHVLEIGCGGGKFTRALFDMGAASVTAIDVHLTALDQARQYEPRADYYLTDGESIPFTEEAGFDLVFTYDVLLHLPPGLVVKYLQEAHRVAAQVIFQLPALDYPAAREWFLRRVAWGAYRNPYELGYFNFYTNDHIRRLAEMAGWCAVYLGHNERDSIWVGVKSSP